MWIMWNRNRQQAIYHWDHPQVSTIVTIINKRDEINTCSRQSLSWHTLLPPWSNISSVWNVWKVFWLWVNHTPRVSGCQFLSKWWAGLLQILVMDLLFCMQPTFQTTYIPSTAISLQHTLRSEDIWLPTGRKNLNCMIANCGRTGYSLDR